VETSPAQRGGTQSESQATGGQDPSHRNSGSTHPDTEPSLTGRPGREREPWQSETVLKLLAFVLPLGLDSFAISAAIGASQVTTARQRLRVSLVFVLFEGGMPLIGRGLGTVLARGIGQAAEYLAGAAVIAIGVWMLLAGGEDEDEKASRITGSRGLALIALGLSISLDELAIGFTIGLSHLPVTGVIVAIALQALIAAQLGLATGARIGQRWRERAERIAAIALILLGTYLIAEQLAQ
jgi:manganese efflux pump family protein